MTRLREDAVRPGLPSDERDEEADDTDAGSGEAALPLKNADDACYRLVSIDAVRAPEGCTGGDWHLYRIARGDDGITGYRRGDLRSVTAGVETIVEGLNGRRQWAKGKVPPKTQRRVAAAMMAVQA